jgi:uncharacterized protein (TIGR02145 family)
MNNRYNIQRELGQGGMAIVYLAEDTRLNAQVALKVLRPEFASNGHIHRRFASEAKSMFRMSHPNIIKVNDLIDDEDTVAIVMEYVEGETLKENIERKGKLKDDEISKFLIQMLDALEYVHEQNLVHRDIKPSNFMITPSGKVKLMDFGIAKQTDPNSSDYTSTGTTQQMGTPMYMSPEQVHETKNVTAQSDIYSLGVVLWQMVTGKRPYDTKTLSSFQLQSKIVNDPLENTHTQWDPIIRKATAKESVHRYSSATAFKKTLIGELESDSTIINDSVEPNSRTSNLEKDKISYTNTGNSQRIANQKNTQRNKLSNELKIFLIVFGVILFGVLFGVLFYSIVKPSRSSYNEGDYYMSFDSTAYADSLAAVQAQAAADSAAAYESQKASEQTGDIIWTSSTNGYFIDIRDNQKYRVVKIGSQIWMADNLRYSSNESVSYKCDSRNDSQGRLYNWNDAKESSPNGWRLPSKKDYDILIKAITQEEFFNSNYFNLYSSGTGFLDTRRCNDDIPIWEEYISFWTSTSYGNEVAWALMYYDTGVLLTWDSSYRKGRTEKGCYYGVRCILDY